MIHVAYSSHPCFKTESVALEIVRQARNCDLEDLHRSSYIRYQGGSLIHPVLKQNAFPPTQALEPTVMETNASRTTLYHNAFCVHRRVQTLDGSGPVPFSVSDPESKRKTTNPMDVECLSSPGRQTIVHQRRHPIHGRRVGS
ncbi:hypothetical protein AC579_7212 [Pseudocercospora musae]|uniref:Uncharacterized protein n=1 Tax=Pseudocercospora musae TaxID=113226 RepID=A0A139H8X5_9PEZI|nr:hypothetical protein AC579_7212 [Pseudocercospora musae]